MPVVIACGELKHRRGALSAAPGSARPTVDDMTLGELLYVALCPDPAPLWVPAGPAQARALVDPRRLVIVGTRPGEADWVRKRFIEGSPQQSVNDHTIISIDEFAGIDSGLMSDIREQLWSLMLDETERVLREQKSMLASIGKCEAKFVRDIPLPRGYQPPEWITKRGRR